MPYIELRRGAAIVAVCALPFAPCEVAAQPGAVGSVRNSATNGPPPSAGARALLDSASAARRHYADARTAANNGNLAAAMEALQRAATAWPAQPAYTAAMATVASRAGAIAPLTAALHRLAQLESGARLLTDSTVRAIAAIHASVGQALSALEVALADQARSAPYVVGHDSTEYPEGVAIHPQTGAVYVAGIRHRRITELWPNGAQRVLLSGDHVGIGAVFAVRVDPDGAHLWATTAGAPQMQGYAPADSMLAALLMVRIRDGAVVRRIPLPGGGVHVPGDLAIAANGDVVVTDSRAPAMYRWRRSGASGDSLETFTHELFRSLQGIVPGGDADSFVVADYSHGLLRVDLRRRTAVRIAHPHDVSTLGLDGIARHGTAIIGIQNGVQPARVVRYELDAAGERITASRTIDRNRVVADEPTNGVVVGDAFYYVANSQWEKYDDSGARVAGTRLTPAVILRLPLDR